MHVPQVNNNGLLSFGQAVNAFVPLPFPLNVTNAVGRIPLIAPYWADSDTRVVGIVYYRESFNSADLDRAQREIRRAFPAQASRFRPRRVFIATWVDIGYFNQHTDRVSALNNVSLEPSYVSVYNIKQ
jgi:hypothetical protein